MINIRSFVVCSIFGLCVSAQAMAQPVIESVESAIESSSNVVISGRGFTHKTNAKPLFWWFADGGAAASNLGRSGWAKAPNGELTSAIVASGSTEAWRFNHGSGGGVALEGVDFDSEKVYIWRKKYDDFNIVENVGSGGFNYKTIRYWNENGSNNLLVGAQGLDGLNYRMTPEYTDKTQWNFKQQQPFRWVTEQFLYKASTIDLFDGVFQLAFDNDWTNLNPVRTVKTTSDPSHPSDGRYNRVVMSQVSNGALNPSWVYYDSVYIDDSWHRVLLSSSATYSGAWDSEVQIPISWSDGRIEVQLRFGGLDRTQPLYLYVVNSDNQANSVGTPLACPKCPVPPAPVVVE